MFKVYDLSSRMSDSAVSATQGIFLPQTWRFNLYIIDVGLWGLFSFCSWQAAVIPALRQCGFMRSGCSDILVC